MMGACLSIVLFLPIYSLYFTEGAGLRLALASWDWVWLLMLAGVCTVYAFSASIELMKRLSAFVINLTTNLEPVYGILLAVLIFGSEERMSTGFYLGTLVILFSVLIHPVLDQWNQRRQQPVTVV
jgi:drug/metabolite transporter (DMT)-like permease